MINKDTLKDRIAKAVEQVTCSRWEDTDDCGYCESSMVTCRHSSYMYCDAHDTVTRPGDRCPHAAEVADAVLPTIRPIDLKGKAEAWDEGYDAGETDGYLIGRDEPFDETTNNPYRTERNDV